MLPIFDKHYGYDSNLIKMVSIWRNWRLNPYYYVTMSWSRSMSYPELSMIWKMALGNMSLHILW